ncbi:MAG: twin-arginine translocation pathway signal protein [Rhodobiaceae bacterium]|nr:MAG: twin-arginine translocation pathway signal protein [Rhodobiaceae bacterium]
MELAMTSRRRFLKIVGSSALIIAGGVGGFALTRTPTDALAPWARAGSADYTDPRVRALSYAILSPNPHNRQPWQVDLGEADTAILSCDLDRLLPHTDPFERQILIGLGCFLDMLRMAAAQDGRSVEIAPFPDGAPDHHLDTRAIARIRFGAPGSATADPLFAQVLKRRSLKEPYDTSRPIPVSAFEQIASVVPANVAVDFSGEPAKRDMLRDLTWQAHLVEVTTHRTNMESVDLMRIGKAEINANPDGIDIGGTAFLDALALAGVLTREQLADPNSVGFKQGLDMYHALMHSAMGHLWLHTKGNSRFDQLNAGAAWLRVNMKATELGLGIHPLSQSLQEYEEMKPLYQEVHEKLLGTSGEDNSGARIQMLGRLGYGPTIRPGPRWPVETRIHS